MISLPSLTDHDPLGTAKLLKDYLDMTSDYRNNAYAGSSFSVMFSKAMELSASIDSILQDGDWSSTRTFNKHHCGRNSIIPSNEVAKILSLNSICDSQGDQE